MTGARAMTATSGPGISLYSENIGLAVMGEVPLVIVDVQRMGPSTGGATTAAQGDVQFVRWGTSGGFPVIALAPASIVDCYRLTIKAFDLAERFRCPVFVVTDKELNLTMNTVDVAALQALPARKRATADEPGAPYRYVPSGVVPPMRHFGDGEIVRFTGSTHDESAYITKDPATVGALNRHLVAKIDDHLDEIEMVEADLEQGARTLVVGYGVTAGAIRVAVQRARTRGHRLGAVTVQSLWPVPRRALTTALGDAERIVVAELNPGLYHREIERLAPDRDVVSVTRMDGELIAPEQILEAAL
jgi:2-oxoglutarate ferredoxin oxidoreductase subunit alpha